MVVNDGRMAVQVQTRVSVLVDAVQIDSNLEEYIELVQVVLVRFAQELLPELFLPVLRVFHDFNGPVEGMDILKVGPGAKQIMLIKPSSMHCVFITVYPLAVTNCPV